MFIFGDHASRYIPPDYDNLGLVGDDLTRHIAWDIGTETVIRHLCKAFGCGGHLAGVSRLLIDFNRSPLAPGLIPEISDGTVVPKNQNLDQAERQARIDQFYTPYHAELSRRIQGLHDPLIVSIHSFTPKLKTSKVNRELDVGLLVKHDFDRMYDYKSALERLHPELRVRINEPYSAYELNHTVDVHLGNKGLKHINIEINQALCDTVANTLVIASKLEDALNTLI